MAITSPVTFLFAFVVSAAMFLCVPGGCPAQDQSAGETPPTNLEVVRALAERIGAASGRLLAGNDSTTVRLFVQPGELAWYIETGLARGLSQEGCRVVASGTAAHVAEFALLNITIEYSNIRRHGFFGPRIVDRRISETLSGKFIDQRSGHVTNSDDAREEARDSIDLSDIGRVESPNLSLLRGVLPPEGFFSNFVEPVILLGSVAVAIYLLFKIRS